MARHRWHFFFWHNTNTYSCKRHFFFWHNTDAYSCKQRSVQMCTDVYRCLRIPLRHTLKLYATGMVELRYKQCSSMGNVQVWATFRYGQRSALDSSTFSSPPSPHYYHLRPPSMLPMHVLTVQHNTDGKPSLAGSRRSPSHKAAPIRWTCLGTLHPCMQVPKGGLGVVIRIGVRVGPGYPAPMQGTLL